MSAAYLTAAEAARRLGISKRLLQRAMQRGEIVAAPRSPGGWVRYAAADVDAYAQSLASSGPRVSPARASQGLPAAPPAVATPHAGLAGWPAATARRTAELTADYAYRVSVLPDGSHRLTWLTHTFTQLTGYSPQDLNSEQVRTTLIYPADQSIVGQRAATLRAGRLAIYEYRIVTKQGEVRWLRDHAHPLWNARVGRVVRIGAAHDITAIKLAEQQIRLQARLLDSVEQAVIATDLEEHIIYWNRFAERLYGWSAAEVRRRLGYEGGLCRLQRQARLTGIKVDRSFVQHLVEDANDAAIVASTVGLAHNLGLHVVAEGVESQEALAHLAHLGCDVAQGYYLSRPLPAESLERWLRETPWAA